MLLHEGDAKYTDCVGENLSNIPRGYQEKSVEELLNHVTSVLLKEGPEVGLILDNCVILVKHLLTVEQVFLANFEQLLDESTEDSGCFPILDAHRI